MPQSPKCLQPPTDAKAWVLRLIRGPALCQCNSLLARALELRDLSRCQPDRSWGETIDRTGDRRDGDATLMPRMRLEEVPNHVRRRHMGFPRRGRPLMTAVHYRHELDLE